jgi:hypothetical protein
MQERYEPFCADFGPVNLGILHQFCQMMQERMNDERLSHRHLVYYADDNPEVRTNVALLVAAYTVTSPRPCLMLAHCALSVPAYSGQVCCHGWTAAQALSPVHTHAHTHTHTHTHRCAVMDGRSWFSHTGLSVLAFGVLGLSVLAFGHVARAFALTRVSGRMAKPRVSLLSSTGTCSC